VNLILAAVFTFIAVAGTLGTIIEKDPFAKLISLSVIAGGVIPFIVDRGYLDVAIAVAIIAPLSTIFLLFACRRESS
jgi:energy-converting hydrogenase A subunit D